MKVADVYSIVPGLVSILFWICGICAIALKGVNRSSLSFFLLCLTTAAWQGSWAILFQITDPSWAQLLVKIGYVPIVYLPTCGYMFLVEVCRKGSERRYVWWSFALSSALALSIGASDFFVAGKYHYYFGYYPKAGILHPIHVGQTLIIALRSFWFMVKKLNKTNGKIHMQIRLCLICLCTYGFAGLDYLCNYGVALYPPGVIFLMGSIVCFASAIMRYGLLHPYSLAASVAHEMRSPLTAVQLYSDELAEGMATLLGGYRLAVESGMMSDSLGRQSCERMAMLPYKIGLAMRQSTATIDTFLAVTRELALDEFDYYSIGQCVADAVRDYPFVGQEHELVTCEKGNDFEFLGSNDLLVFVLFNLLKNSLWAIKDARKGIITIKTYTAKKSNVLEFRDTASGIDSDVMPYIFDEFFSTKQKSGGTGVGLSFCRYVIQAFGGTIRCSSEYGAHTTFFLEFPILSLHTER